MLIFSDKAEYNMIKWVHKQRMFFRRGKYLNSEQIDLLNRINLVWDPAEYVWNIRLNELKKFKRIHGHRNVSRGNQRNPKLAMWVHSIRGRNKKHTLSRQHILDLNELNFEWNPQTNRHSMPHETSHERK